MGDISLGRVAGLLGAVIGVCGGQRQSGIGGGTILRVLDRRLKPPRKRFMVGILRSVLVLRRGYLKYQTDELPLKPGAGAWGVIYRDTSLR